METIKWLEYIEVFSQVCQFSSFSEAARSLDISKSQVSKMVSALEKELGVALLYRSTRNVKTTARGDEYLIHCREVLNQLNSSRQKLKSFSHHPSGVLRVTMAGIFGEEFVAPILINMARKFPELKIEVHFDSRIMDLITERFDVAIRVGNLPSSSLIGQKVASRREFVCATPDYLKNQGIPLLPLDLKNHNCLSNTSHWQFKIKDRHTAIDINGNFRSNNPRVILNAALSDLGILRLPGSYIYEYLQKGQLVEVLEKYNPGKVDIWAVTPMKQELNVNVKTFLIELKKHLSEDFPGQVF